MNYLLACVAVVSCFLAATSGQHFVSDYEPYEQSHWRDACFCLGFNPDEHRQAAECMYAIIYSAENYMSDGHGDLISHLYSARNLLGEFIHGDDGDHHHSHGSHDHDGDHQQQIDLYPVLADVMCMRDAVEGVLTVDSMYGRGTVCDDGFSTPEANAFCQTMGFEYGEYMTRNGEHLGIPIALDDVTCREGDHAHQCTHLGWEQHNCGHHEDVALICYYPYDEALLRSMCDAHHYESSYGYESSDGSEYSYGDQYSYGDLVMCPEGWIGQNCDIEAHDAHHYESSYGYESSDGSEYSYGDQYSYGDLVMCPDGWIGQNCDIEAHVYFWPSMGDIMCGGDSVEGLVILDIDGQQGTVCANVFGHNEARAVCLNHGFADGEPLVRDGSMSGLEQQAGGFSCPEFEDYADFYQCQLYRQVEDSCYGMDAAVRCFDQMWDSAALYIYDTLHHNSPCQPEVYWPSLGDITCMGDEGIEALVVAQSNMDYDRKGTVCIDGFSQNEALAVCNNHGFSHGEVVQRDGTQWVMEQVIGGYMCPEPSRPDVDMPMPMSDGAFADTMIREPYYHMDFGLCDTYPTDEHCYGRDAAVRCSNPHHPGSGEHVWDSLTEATPCLPERFWPNLGDLNCMEASNGVVEGLLIGTSNVHHDRKGLICADTFGENEAIAVCSNLGFMYGEPVVRDVAGWDLEVVSDGYVCPPDVHQQVEMYMYYDFNQCDSLPASGMCMIGAAAVRCSEPHYEGAATYVWDILHETSTCRNDDFNYPYRYM